MALKAETLDKIVEYAKPFVKTAKNGEWHALVNRFQQIHEMRICIFILPKGLIKGVYRCRLGKW